MRILLVITKADVGGAQKRVFDLARKYKEAGHGVGVAYGENGPLVAELESHSIATWQFKHLKRSRSPLSMFLYIREIRKFLNKIPFDVVHFNSSNTLAGALGAKRARNKPKTIFTFRGLSMLDFGSPMPNHKKFIYWMYFKYFLRFVDTPVFQCKRNQHDAKRLFLVHNRNTNIIYPGIDPQVIDFLPQEPARQFLEMNLNRKLGRSYILGSIGRLSDEKNYEFLIKNFEGILKRNRKAVLVLVGEGGKRKKLEQLVSALGLDDHVFFTGEVADAATLLKAFDLFVLPSHFEGVSVVLTEALFANIPILTSNAGGNKEVVCGNETAFYKTGDADDFLNKFEDIIYEDEISFPCKEKFLLSRSSTEYLELYQSLHGERA